MAETGTVPAPLRALGFVATKAEYDAQLAEFYNDEERLDKLKADKLPGLHMYPQAKHRAVSLALRFYKDPRAIRDVYEAVGYDNWRAATFNILRNVEFDPRPAPAIVPATPFNREVPLTPREFTHHMVADPTIYAVHRRIDFQRQYTPGMRHRLTHRGLFELTIDPYGTQDLFEDESTAGVQNKLEQITQKFMVRGIVRDNVRPALIELLVGMAPYMNLAKFDLAIDRIVDKFWLMQPLVEALPRSMFEVRGHLDHYRVRPDDFRMSWAGEMSLAVYLGLTFISTGRHSFYTAVDPETGADIFRNDPRAGVEIFRTALERTPDDLLAAEGTFKEENVEGPTYALPSRPIDRLILRLVVEPIKSPDMDIYKTSISYKYAYTLRAGIFAVIVEHLQVLYRTIDGDNLTLRQYVKNLSYAFEHKAPLYVREYIAE